jgi:hypothetical protein
MITDSFDYFLFAGLKVLFFISTRHLGWQLTVYKPTLSFASLEITK